MEFLKLCCVTPHPPIMVPEVGGPEVKKVAGSNDAMEKLAADVERIAPETIVIMSPHSQIYADAFTVKTAPMLSGSFAMFGAAHVRMDTTPDLELAQAVIEKAAVAGVPCEAIGGAGRVSLSAGELDHGIMVPLYFLAQKTYPLVCLSMSFLDFRSHYIMGIAIRDAIASVGRRAVFVASGDMSHRLTPGAPAGYSPRAAEFDKQIVEITSSGDYARLFELDPELIEEAGECGLRSIITMAGTVDGYGRSSEVLSYEGPFGVGYMVARMEPGEADATLSLIKDGGP
jgi:aromatic ring-opening dioxygenase LigB subunit